MIMMIPILVNNLMCNNKYYYLTHRDVLTANLTLLKPRRHKEGDSGEDMASDDNITDDELDLDTIEMNEDYAVTFDLPGTLIPL
jgi:hypothetical protein